jgi:hypothetical protein
MRTRWRAWSPPVAAWHAHVGARWSPWARLGWDALVWCVQVHVSTSTQVLASHVLGGVLVSLTLKHADNVLKTFATAVALIASCLGSYFLFASSLAPLFLCGIGLVVASTLLYTLQLDGLLACAAAILPWRGTAAESALPLDAATEEGLRLVSPPGVPVGTGGGGRRQTQRTQRQLSADEAP